MNKKKVLILVISIVLLAGVFGAIAVGITSTTMATTETGGESAENSEKSDGAAAEADKEAAEELIEKTISRDEIKDSVGEWDKFEMSSDGCERGVYAGRFYYNGFVIYSRTYDKGETFHIMSVNE